MVFQDSLFELSVCLVLVFDLTVSLLFLLKQLIKVLHLFLKLQELDYFFVRFWFPSVSDEFFARQDRSLQFG